MTVHLYRAMVTFHMFVQIGHSRWISGSDQLWHKQMNVAFVPTAGERFELWAEGPIVEVKERYLDYHGDAHCDLSNCVINPDADEERWQGSGAGRSWTYPGSDSIERKLEQHGWTVLRESEA